VRLRRRLRQDCDLKSSERVMWDTHTRETEAKENDSEEDAGDGDETLDNTTPEIQVGGHITGVQRSDNRSWRTSLSRKRRVTVTRSSIAQRLRPSSIVTWSRCKATTLKKIWGTSLLCKQMLDGNETLVGTTPDIYRA